MSGMTRRNFLVAAGVVGVSAALTACESKAKKSGADTGTQQPGSSAPPVVKSDDPALKPFYEANIDWQQAKGASIRVALQDAPSVKEVRKHIDKFTALTGITVQVEELPWTGLHEKILADLQSKTGNYDVVMHGYYTTSLYQRGKFIENLDTYINDPKLTDKKWFALEDIFQSTRDMTSWDGVLYSIPFYTETFGLFYRKDLFAQKGITKLPETWEEYEDLARKLHNPPEVYGTVSRGSRDHSPPNLFAYLHAYGADYMDAKGHAALNTAEAEAALDHYTKVLLEAGPPGVAAFGFPETLETFKQGKAAMMMDSSVFGPGLQYGDDSKVKGQIGFAMVPKGPKRRAPGGGTICASLNAASRNKKAGWLFLQWLTSRPIAQVTTVDGLRGDATRISVWESPEVKEMWAQKGLDEWRQNTLQSFKESTFPERANPACRSFEPKFPEYLETRQYLGEAISSVLAKAKNVKQALAEATQSMDKVLKDAGYF